MRTALFILALCLACGALYCDREDGLPDPPVRALVPCDPKAPPGDSTACPDLAAPADMDGGPIADGGAG